MTPLPNIEPSLTERIISELLDMLASQPEFEGAVLDGFQLIAKQERFSSEKDVTNAIKRLHGGSNAAS